MKHATPSRSALRVALRRAAHQIYDTPLVFVISLHSFIMGQPFRLARLRRALQHVLSHQDEIWVTLPGEIARYYRELPTELQLHADPLQAP